MNTDKTYSISTTSSDESENLGEKLGRKLTGGEVIELTSDLGGGKTTFVRGLAKGAGSKDIVASPTFMICKQYKAKDLTIYHYDFYRLSDPGIIRHELEEGLSDPKAVVVVEWADIIKDVLPDSRLKVNIKSTGENNREISIRIPQDLNYLMEEI